MIRVYNFLNKNTTGMDISLELSPEGKMIAKGAAGYPVFVNRIDPLHPEGTGPMELVLEGLAGCASIDVLMILEKQRAEVRSYRVDVHGDRSEGVAARPFNHITMHFSIGTDLAEEKVKRAISLSLEKYCSVAAMLDKTATIEYTLTIL